MTDDARAAAARVRESLSGEQAPRFLGRPRLAAMAGCAPDALKDVISDLTEQGSLCAAGDDVFVNRLAMPTVHPNEFVAHLGGGAYASLHTVLGESGVANNPSRTVYAVRADGPTVGSADVRFRSPLGEYRMIAMPASMMEAGEVGDRLEAGGRYPRATPEKAFVDWIWLASGAGRARLSDPPLDLDLSELDHGRIARLAEAMGVTPALSAWMARHEEALADPAVDGNYSPGLGF